MTTSRAVGELISLAGGRVIGRTKLQKSACALELMGLGYGFRFAYKHFGPYSDELRIACGDAEALGYIRERTETASWGGWYSVFENTPIEPASSVQKQRNEVLSITASADSVDLELAITAAFLAANGVNEPWREVERRKSAKATPERMQLAKDLYKRLSDLDTPRALPKID